MAGGILITEKKIIQYVTDSEHHRTNSKIIVWDNFACPPIAQFHIHSVSPNPNGGTDPVCILKRDITATPIKQSDALWLLTDGSIEPNAVSAFADMIASRNIARIPRSRYAPTDLPTRKSQSAPLFFLADHCLFLYADSSMDARNQQFYFLQAKGYFKHLGVVETLDRMVEWSNSFRLRQPPEDHPRFSRSPPVPP